MINLFNLSSVVKGLSVPLTIASGHLAGSDNVLGGIEVGDYLFWITAADVVCIHYDSTARVATRKGYATLAGIVGVCSDGTNLWLATSAAGVYKIALATLTAGSGDVTPGGWGATLTATSAPAIYSNACTGIACNDAGTRLAVACGRVTLVVLAAGVPSATYDSASTSACAGAIEADGNRLAWVRNGEVGVVCVLEDMTVPVADGWVAPPYGHFSDDFAGTGAPDTARWAIEVSGSPTSTTATRSGGALLLGLTHRNAAGTDSVRAYCAQPAIGVSDFSLKVIFGAATIPTLEAGSDDSISCPFDIQIFDSAWAQQIYLVIAGYKKAASEYIGASLYRGGSLIFSTNVTQNWVAGVTFYLERSGTTISASYDNGGGKTQISADSHADNDNNGRLWYRVRLDHAEVVTPYNRSSQIRINDFQVVAPAAYDALPAAPITALALKSGAGTSRLLLGSAAGAALIDTDESAWSSLPNFALKTYGASGSGADHEVLESSDVLAVALNAAGDEALVGLDGDGLDHIELTTDTRLAHYDTVSSLALVGDTVRCCAFGSLFYGTSAGAGVLETDEGSLSITGLSDGLFGVHLRNRLALFGSGFDSSLVADVDGDAVTIAVVSANRINLKLPLYTSPGRRILSIGWPSGAAIEIPLLWSDTGYRVLRALLPPGRYTSDPTNPFNVRLASRGQEQDRILRSAQDLMRYEIHPETTQQCLPLHEQMYSLSYAPGDSYAVRLARVVALASRMPSISVPYLELIAQAYKAGAAITEFAPFTLWGGYKFWFVVYESAPNELDARDRAQLEKDLQAYGPGWAHAAVGALGFVVSESRVTRDFVDSEA